MTAYSTFAELSNAKNSSKSLLIIWPEFTAKTLPNGHALDGRKRKPLVQVDTLGLVKVLADPQRAFHDKRYVSSIGDAISSRAKKRAAMPPSSSHEGGFAYRSAMAVHFLPISPV